MRALREYAVVTGAYWVFTLTDGALRMLMLFHLHRLGYSPVEVVSLFLFYEFFGIVTNFVGGWLGARFGLKWTLFLGLSLQIVACSVLAWRAQALTIPLVMAAQGLSGIAKDLTKMSSKSYVKLVVPEGDSRGLMKWVALLTGSKNALKGLGFFLGGALLGLVGFANANWGMSAALALALMVSILLLPQAMGRAKEKPGLSALISRDPRINWLSAARLFLFASRDVWFVFALPIYLSSELGWSHAGSGAFLAAWVIGYGMVQASAPRLVGGKGAAKALDGGRALRLTLLLSLPLAVIAALLYAGLDPALTLIGGLVIFGVVFAACSALHSFLIVHYAERGQVSLGLGFYYSANAAGRLAGTIASGLVYQAAGSGKSGLIACLAVSLASVLLSALLCLLLIRAEERLAAPSS
ncbi:MAG: MFS transporter [Planctomycetota bacterium]|nr:MAG: MFS transporter [Planctomycetota bacterium]